jgi:hypothetical protein
LLATALSNVALAIVVAGFVAPLVTGQLHSPGNALVMSAWIGTGFARHFGAQLVLGRLRQ